MSRRLRLTLLSLGGLALAVVLAAMIAVYLLLQPDRFTAMLQTQAQAAGLELNLASPASPTLFPRPALDLKGITLNAAGANAPILLAARGQLALPWHTLLGGPTVITQLQIDSPRVDLDALQGWVASLPAQPEGAPPNIPRIDAGVSITRGSVVRGNQVLLDNVSLETGSLLSGQPFPLNLSATTSTGTPLQMRLSATPRIQGNTLQLDNVSLHLSQGAAMTLALNGSAHWHGAADAAASLTGTLDEASTGKYDIALMLTPADENNPLLLALKLDGPDNHADLRLPPLALANWWSQLNNPRTPQLAVPPGDGHAEIASITVGGVSIEGLTVQAGDAIPAPPSTAAPSAKPAVNAKP
ncbi:MAG: AsmA family protein [Pseudomonadota bacterium]|nr:AsmA family protein [Pseudomonadota bacterium]